jgi:hypothetical protein
VIERYQGWLTPTQISINNTCRRSGRMNLIKIVGLGTMAVLLALWIHEPVVPLLDHQPQIVARTKATGEEKRENKRIAREYSRALGYSRGEVACLVTLWTRESRFDHLADNKRSSAYGIAQLLREVRREPELQILHGLRYIEHRYRGSACSALRHSDRRGWY